MATAFLYDDGSFVFSSNGTADASKTLVASYKDWEVGTVPWYDDGNNERVISVSFEDTVSPVSTSYWFSVCINLTSFDSTNLDTSNTTDMSGMFTGCSVLTSLDVSNFDTSNVVSMENMFSDCSALTSLDLSSFDTSKVEDMSYMFISSALRTIYVSNLWSIQSVTNSNKMFRNCDSLVGGNGTAYDISYVDSSRACIDTPETPGYFTYKPYYPLAIRGDHIIQGETLYEIAEAIRSKTGSTDSMTPSQMVEAVNGFSGGPIVGMVDLAEDAREIVIPVDKLYSHLVLFPISIANPNALLSTASVVPLCLTTPEEEFRYNSAFIYSGSDLTPGWYDAEADEFYDDGFQISGFMWGVVNGYPCVVFSETEIKARHISSSGYKNLAAGKYAYVAW